MALSPTLPVTNLAGSRVWAEVDLAAIRHNINELRKLIAPSQIMAVVKANAYGLGAVAVARTALDAGACALAVATVEEGQELRQAEITAPILVLGYTPPAMAGAAIEARLTLTVNSLELVKVLIQTFRNSERPAHGWKMPVHLKLDTGLNRFGLDPEQALQIARLISTEPELYLQGLYSHFATGDEADLSFVHEQHKRFEAARIFLQGHGFHFDQLHLSNSASGISVKEARYDMVRAGLAIYGYYPSAIVKARAQQAGLYLKPALTLKSLLARVSRLEKGESVGYNRTWIAPEDRSLGLVPVGYADGYRRELGNQAAALVNGQRAGVIGRVSMDQITLDLSDLSGNITEGNEVILIGADKGEEITLEEVAGLCGTISYEILTGLGRRVKRVYTGL